MVKRTNLSPLDGGKHARFANVSAARKKLSKAILSTEMIEDSDDSGDQGKKDPKGVKRNKNCINSGENYSDSVVNEDTSAVDPSPKSSKAVQSGLQAPRKIKQVASAAEVTNSGNMELTAWSTLSGGSGSRTSSLGHVGAHLDTEDQDREDDETGEGEDAGDEEEGKNIEKISTVAAAIRRRVNGLGKNVRFAKEEVTGSRTAVSSDSSSDDASARVTPIIKTSALPQASTKSVSTVKRPKSHPPETQAHVSSDSDSSESHKQDNGPRSVRTFNPPKDFETFPASSTISEATNEFIPSNDEGKQVWYISAPEFVPLTILKEAILETRIQGKACKSHQDKEYDFVSESDLKSTTHLLIHGQNGLEFTPTRLDDVLRLREKRRIPALSEPQISRLSGIPTISAKMAAATKPKRNQPKGLRRKYRPPGSGEGALDNLESASDNDVDVRLQPQFRSPPQLNAQTSGKKRKDRENEVIHDHEEMEHKHKSKKKKHKSSQASK